MQALILAAGMGTRLKELTQNNAKCMLTVNGITLIERMIKQLDDLDLSKIIIVTGYLEDNLKEYLNKLEIVTPIEYYSNPIYNKTNNIHSLALAKSVLTDDDTLLLESDLIIADGVLKDLLLDKRPNLALVDKYDEWMDGTAVILDSNEKIIPETNLMVTI